jgi:hypothetical protein
MYVLFFMLLTMNQIDLGKTSDQTGEHYMDFDWIDFGEKLFAQPPQNPFAFTLSFLDEINERQLAQLLGTMLVNGVKQRYHKEIAQLTQQEIEEIQKYYHSIGYEVKYTIETQDRFVESLNKTVPVNLFSIDFVPYSRQYDKFNQPEKIIP